MKRNIKINHFDKVKGRQKKVHLGFFFFLSHFYSPFALDLCFIFRLFFMFQLQLAFTGFFFSLLKVCWLKGKLLPKCNLNLSLLSRQWCPSEKMIWLDLTYSGSESPNVSLTNINVDIKQTFIICKAYLTVSTLR